MCNDCHIIRLTKVAEVLLIQVQAQVLQVQVRVEVAELLDHQVGDSSRTGPTSGFTTHKLRPEEAKEVALELELEVTPMKSADPQLIIIITEATEDHHLLLPTSTFTHPDPVTSEALEAVAKLVIGPTPTRS